MRSKRWCLHCETLVEVNRKETADGIAVTCGKCQSPFSSEKKNEETQQLTSKLLERSERRMGEKDVCVFGVIPGDFNTILLVKNLAETKEWGFKPAGWGRPGGSKGPDESEAEALIREVWEETGLSVEVISSTRHEEDKGSHLDITFICRIIPGGKLKSRSQWFPLESLPKSIYSFHRQMILLLAGQHRQNQRSG